MAYEKQNFKSGEKLYASQLNAMDAQIAKNEQDVKSLNEEIANKGNPTNEQVRDAVNAYLEANPVQPDTSSVKAVEGFAPNDDGNVEIRYPAKTKKGYRHHNLSTGEKTVNAYSDERYTNAPHIFFGENYWPETEYVSGSYTYHGMTFSSDKHNITVKGTATAAAEFFLASEDGGDSYWPVPKGLNPGERVSLYVFATLNNSTRAPAVRAQFFDANKTFLKDIAARVPVGDIIKSNVNIIMPAETVYMRFQISYDSGAVHDHTIFPVLIKASTEVVNNLTFSDGVLDIVTENVTTEICTAPYTSDVVQKVGLKEYIDTRDKDADNNEGDLSHQTYVSPEMFGAYGNGSKDDTVALQAAIDYGEQNGKTVIGGGSYLISAPIKINGRWRIVELHEILYDGTECAVIASGNYNELRFGRIRALSGVAFRLNAGEDGAQCNYNNISINRAMSAKNTVEYYATKYHIVGNRLTFGVLSSGKGYACVWHTPFDFEVEGDFDVGNNNFYGGRLEGGAWGVYNARHQDTYMTCMFENIDNCIHQGGAGMVRVIAPRYVEIVNDNPQEGKGIVYKADISYDIIPQTSRRHAKVSHLVLSAPSSGLFTSSIDVENVPIKLQKEDGTIVPIRKNESGSIKVPTRLINSNGSLVARSFMIFGNHLLIDEPATRKSINVTANNSGYAGDYRTTGNDDEFYIYDTFIIDENGCDYTLPPSYDAIAFNEFVVVQQEGTYCTFRDWRGTVVFNGAEYGAGIYKVIVGTSYAFVGDYENNGQIWEIRRMSDYSLVDTMPHVET